MTAIFPAGGRPHLHRKLSEISIYLLRKFSNKHNSTTRQAAHFILLVKFIRTASTLRPADSDPTDKMSLEYLPLAIATLLDRIGRLIQAECFTDELPPVQWSALRFLAQNSAARQTIGGLAAFTGVGHSSASRTVAVLVKKGLLTIDDERGHDRSRRITLTPEGWALLKKDPLTRIVKVVASLPHGDQAAVHNSLNQLLSGIGPRPD